MPLVKYKHGQSDVEYIVYGTKVTEFGETLFLIDLYCASTGLPFSWVYMRDCVPYYE